MNDHDDLEDRPLPRGDATRDARLQAALQHAPDSALKPPPALSAAILQAAHAAVAPVATGRIPATSAPASPSVWDRMTRWIDAGGTALQRPAFATGLTGVMVATLVGLLWWDQPVPDVLPTRAKSTPSVSSPQPVPDPPPASAATPVPAQPAKKTGSPSAKPGTAGEERARTSAPSPSATPALRAPEQRQPDTAPAATRNEAVSARQREGEARVTPPAAPMAMDSKRAAGVDPTAASGTRSRREEGASAATAVPDDARARATAADTAAGPKAATAPAPSLSRDAAEPPSRVAARAEAAGTSAGEEKTNSTPRADRQRETASLALRSATAAMAARQRDSAVPASSAPQESDMSKLPAHLLARVEADPARWRWQHPGQASTLPADAAALAWLRRLATAGKSGWQMYAGPLPAGDRVVWWQDGQVEAEALLVQDRVLWLPRGGAILSLAVPAPALRALGTW